MPPRAALLAVVLAGGCPGSPPAPGAPAGAPPAAPVAAAVAIPGPGALLLRLTPGHPRILLPADRGELRRQVLGDGRRAAAYRRLAERLPAPAARGGSRGGAGGGRTGRGPGGDISRLAMTAGLCYRVDGDSALPEMLWPRLEAAARRPDWHPEFFLDTTEVAAAVAIAYDWMYDAWTPAQRDLLRQALVDKALRPALAAYRGQAKGVPWADKDNNWNLVSNSGVVLAALAVAGEAPDVAGEALAAALGNVRQSLASYGPDGGWKEGPNYWAFATEHAVAMLAALSGALGTDYGLSDVPGFAATGFFPIYVTGPTGLTFNFSDSRTDEVPRADFLLWLAGRFGEPAFAAFAARTLAAGGGGAARPEQVLWDRAPDPAALSRLPLDRHFRDVEVATFRSAWDDPRALFVGFKAGDNRAEHGHLDQGTFVLDAGGERWIGEAAHADYNLPRYWDYAATRWTYYATRAEAHNTLLLDPGRGPDQDPGAGTRIRRFESHRERALAIADLTPVYGGAARRVERGVEVRDRREVLVQDEVAAARPVDLWWLAHTAARVEIADGGRRALLTLGAESLEARLLAPAAAAFQLLPEGPLPTSPNPPQQRLPGAGSKLAIHLPGTLETRIAVAFTPGAAVGPAPAVRPLADW